LVSGAVRRNRLLNKPSNADVENEVKVWLRQSCDSSGGRQARAAQRSVTRPEPQYSDSDD